MLDINLITRTWGKREGWVSCSTKDASGRWRDHYFHWPSDKSDFITWLNRVSEGGGTDLYWCLTPLSSRSRRKTNVIGTSVLWADCDEANPYDFDIRPTAAWESSPGRYQAVWRLSKFVRTPELIEKLNYRLAKVTGSDMGGWDLSQVLRIPGSRNWKYPNAPEGRLLWDDGPVYDSKELLQKLPVLSPESTVDDSLEGALPDPAQVIKAHKRVLPKMFFDLWNSKEAPVGTRSDKLWQMTMLLAEAGMSVEEVVSVTRASIWNKYRGRRDELSRLVKEAKKAVGAVGDNGSGLPPSLEADTPTDLPWLNFDVFMATHFSAPTWLVQDIWQKESHGIVAGEPKSYKSFLATDLAVAVASGKPFLGKYPVSTPGPVIIIQEENAPWLLQDRLAKVMYHRGLVGKVSKNLVVKFPQDLPIVLLNNYGYDFTIYEHQSALEKLCEVINPELIIFDPLYLMLGDKDENSAKDLRPVLSWLLQLRYTYSTAIMVVHHWSKSNLATRGGQRILGSTTLHGWTESAMYIGMVDEAQHVVAVEREYRSFPKRNLITVQFELGDPGDFKYIPTVQEGEGVDQRDVSSLQATLAEDAILRLVEAQPGVTVRDIARATGATDQKVRRILKALEGSGFLLSEQGGGSRSPVAYYLKGGQKT